MDIKVVKQETTQFGTFKIYDTGVLNIDLSENWKTALIKALSGFIFEEEGLKGVRYYGEIVIPPLFDDIGILHNPDRLYLVHGERFSRFENFGNYEMYDDYVKDSHFIFDKDKMGWSRNGKTVVRPLFDDVERWGLLGLYQTRINDKYQYFTEDGREVLGFRREIRDEDGSPFWMRSDEGESFSILECPPSSSLPECNIWEIDNLKVGMDRCDRVDLLKELVNPDDILPMTRNEVSGLTNAFSYEFSAYRFMVSGENLVEDLKKLFNKFVVDDNTWFYVIRLTTAKGETISASQLEKMNNFIDNLERRPLGKDFAVGEDETLPKGSVSALIITHYNECCFPPGISFEWIEVCNKGSLNDVIDKDIELQCFTRQYVEDVAKEDFLTDTYDSYFSNIRYYSERPWEVTEKVLDYVSEKTEVFKTKVRSAIKDIESGDTDDEKNFFLNYLGWLLSKGTNPNKIIKGKTPLDEINEKLIKSNDNNPSYLRKIKDLLVSHGGKTFDDFKSDFLKEKSEYEFSLYLLDQ